MTSRRLLQSFIRTTTIAAMIVFMGAGLAQAQSTWYVSSTEGDNNNDGSQMENAGAGTGPFAEIATAVAAASDGDTIVVLAGNYAENIDLDVSVSLQAQASGINLAVNAQALTLNDADGASIVAGTGLFDLSGNVTLTDGSLSVADGELALQGGVSVSIVDGTMTGSSPTYAGAYSLTYNPTDVDGDNAPVAANISAGTELAGDMGAGTLTIAEGWVTGSLTIDGDLTTTTLLVSGDADVTVTGDMDGNIDHDGAGSTTVSGSLTGNIDAAVGDVDVSGTVTGSLVSAANSDINIDGDVVAATVTNAGATTIGGDLTATGAITGTAGSLSVTGTVTAESTISLTAAGATTGAVIAWDTVTINNDDEVTAENVTFASLFMVGAAQLVFTDGTTTISGALYLGTGADDGDSNTNEATVAAGAVTVGSIVTIAADDDNDEVAVTYDEVAVTGGSLTVTGTVTESAAEEDVKALELAVADGALLAFETSTTVSGDVNNANGAAVLNTDGIQIGSGATLTLAYVGDFTDLGAFIGAGSLEISEGTVVIDNLVELEQTNLVLSAERDITLASFDFGADVTISAASAIVSVDDAYTVAGDLTISAAVTIGDGAEVVESVIVNGDVSVTSDGALVFGANDDNDDDTFEVDGVAAFNDATLNSTLNADGSGVTFTGTNTVLTAVDAEGTVTVSSGTTTFTAGGDVAGATSVDGTLVLSADTGFGSLAVGVDGTVNANANNITVSGDLSGGTLTDFGVVTFTVPADGATFTPGPDTVIDGLTVNGSGRTLSVGQGFATSGNIEIGDDATLALGNNTLTAGGDLTLTDEAVVTNGEFGAIAFNADASITVADNPTTDPTLSSIRVNNGATVTVVDDIFVSGDLALNDGTLEIDADITVTMTGDSAQITRNPGTGALTNNGTLTGAWDLVYFGVDEDGVAQTTGEFADGKVRNVTVNMTSAEVFTFSIDGEMTGNLSLLDGDVNVSAALEVGGNVTNSADLDDFEVTGSLTIGGDFTITDTGAGDFTTMDVVSLAGNLTVPTGVTLGSAEGVITLTGDGSVVSNGGNIAAELTVGTDITVTINGTTSEVDFDGHFDVIDIDAGTITFNDVQSVGDVTVNDATVTLTLVEGSEAEPAGAPGTGAITVDSAADESASLTIASDVDISTGVGDAISLGGNSTLEVNADLTSAGLTLGDANDVISLAIGSSNTLSSNGDITAHAEATVTVTGGILAIEGDGGGTVAFGNHTVPTLHINASADIVEYITVGTLVVDAAVVVTLEDAPNAQKLTLTGDATLGAGASLTAGTLNVTEVSTVTIGATASVAEFDANAAVTLAGDGKLTVGDLTIGAAGTVTTGADTDVTITGIFDYGSESATALDNSAYATITFGSDGSTTVLTNGNDITVGGRVYVYGVMGMNEDTEGSFTATGQLYLYGRRHSNCYRRQR